MKIPNIPVLNVAEDTFTQEMRRIVDETPRLKTLRDQQNFIDHSRQVWKQIEELEASPGWAHIKRMFQAEIERLRGVLENPAEERVLIYAQASIKALRTLLQFPALAVGATAALDAQQRALDQEKVEFVFDPMPDREEKR